MINVKKIETRIIEIDTFFENNRDFTKFDSGKLFKERSELEFKRNKQNINIKLSYDNKYYYANQCYKFAQHILSNGYPYKDIKEMQSKDIYFNKYSITIGESHDLKRFNSKEEMLGFVIGYNTANNI